MAKKRRGPPRWLTNKDGSAWGPPECTLDLFVCPACGTVFGSITDRTEREKFRYREPRIDER